jgi:hypothetical protein
MEEKEFEVIEMRVAYYRVKAFGDYDAMQKFWAMESPTPTEIEYSRLLDSYEVSEVDDDDTGS